MLAFPAALLVLWWFRRGTTLRGPVAGAALGVMLLIAPEARAQAPVATSTEAPVPEAGWIARLFLTPDQQGARAYAGRRFPEAAARFADPAWRAVALMRAGQYADAAGALEPVQTADAQYNRGVALVRGRDYQGAVAAFTAALALDPQDRAAAENLALTRRIIAYLDEMREAEDPQADTEDNAADGTVEDLQSDEGGRRMRITGDTDLSADAAEQWMRQVQTRPADFLKSRFAAEAARGPRP